MSERPSRRIADCLERIFGLHPVLAPGSPFGKTSPLWAAFDELRHAVASLEPVAGRGSLRVKQSAGLGRKALTPWLALLDERETRSTRSGVYVVLLFRPTGPGAFLTLAQGVEEPRSVYGKGAVDYLRKTASQLRDRLFDIFSPTFRVDDDIDLGSDDRRARDYEASVVAYKAYEPGSLPNDADVAQDLEILLTAYERYILTRNAGTRTRHSLKEQPSSDDEPKHDTRPASPKPFDLAANASALVESIDRLGLVFEPWQVATYLTAIRTKPFAILAGITGTGKSTLPRVVAELTGGEAHLVPVRPDWTDSADVLGYRDLNGQFRPGEVLSVARRAHEEPDRQVVCVLDEMNLARVEQYLAEILSRIEDRRATPQAASPVDRCWAKPWQVWRLPG